MSRKVIVGVDFDNTLVDYDDLLETLAVERLLLPARAGRSKQAVRDLVRTLPDGETHWQLLQGAAYGPRIGQARLFAGVSEFLRLCREAGVPVYIVSHKTEFATFDETHTNLRKAALGWMDAHQFFSPRQLGLSMRAVFFRSTRTGKVKKIKELGCTHFIDDLEETFQEKSFPSSTAQWHFCPKPGASHTALACARFKSWDEMTEQLSAEIRKGSDHGKPGE